MTVAAEVAVPEVVREQEDNVRKLRGGRRRCHADEQQEAKD